MRRARVSAAARFGFVFPANARRCRRAVSGPRCHLMLHGMAGKPVGGEVLARLAGVDAAAGVGRWSVWWRSKCPAALWPGGLARPLLEDMDEVEARAIPAKSNDSTSPALKRPPDSLCPVRDGTSKPQLLLPFLPPSLPGRSQCLPEPRQLRRLGELSLSRRTHRLSPPAQPCPRPEAGVQSTHRRRSGMRRPRVSSR